MATVDKYFEDEHVFEVLGKLIVVTGDLLAEAIAKLPEDKRDVVLLSYFLGMSDREISEHRNMVRQTISKRRTKTLKELREYLEGGIFMGYAIGEFSSITGISIYTLQYYEKEKLIIPERKENGRRLYSDGDISWIQFIKR